METAAKPDIAELHISGPVDGLNELHPLGSYYRFSLIPKNGEPTVFLVSEGNAEAEFWIVGAGRIDE